MKHVRTRKNAGIIRGVSEKPRGSAPAAQQAEATSPATDGGANTNVAHRQSAVHQTACDLLAALQRVEEELCQSESSTEQSGESRWANINAALVSLRTVWNRLGACRANLDLFRGLRPDGVSVCGIVCGSWHQGVIHIGDAVYKLLRIPLGGEAAATGEYLWAPEEADWTRDDLGLPNAREQEPCRSRAELWNRAVAFYRSENTLVAPTAPATAEVHTSGWATLRELDFRSLPAQLAAEWRFVTRQHTLTPVGGEGRGRGVRAATGRRKLSDFQRKILITMLASGITSFAKRRKQNTIRLLVDSKSTSTDGRPFAELSRWGLTTVHPGAEAGYWLSKAGQLKARLISVEELEAE